MSSPIRTEHLHESILSHARKDFCVLKETMTIEEALASIRSQGMGERIVYFYVLNEEEQLIGVIPTRRLLTRPLEKKLSEVMIRRLVTISEQATVREACEFFVMYKFYAFPIVNEEKKLLGMVDVRLFTEEVFDLAERERTDTIFESLGFRISEVKGVSSGMAFRARFPWLLATIISGTLCAMLTSSYETTLAKSLVLAFFLTLVLGLGESVAMQSMTLAIQTLHNAKPTLAWYRKALWKEIKIALMLGLSCGSLVWLIAWIWQGSFSPALVIGLGIFFSLSGACFFGLSLPSVLHALRLDPKIAAGPITLALADLWTLLGYFTLGLWILP